MLSTRLVQLIETNWQEIARRLIHKVRTHEDMANLAGRPDAELRDWCREILENMGYLLTATRSQEIQRRYEVMGRVRFEESIPLHEAVLRMHMLKDEIVGYVHEQGLPMTSLQLYAEEELEHRVCRFFDALVYRIVRGYEEAMRRSARYA